MALRTSTSWRVIYETFSWIYTKECNQETDDCWTPILPSDVTRDVTWYVTCALKRRRNCHTNMYTTLITWPRPDTIGFRCRELTIGGELAIDDRHFIFVYNGRHDGDRSEPGPLWRQPLSKSRGRGWFEERQFRCKYDGHTTASCVMLVRWTMYPTRRGSGRVSHCGGAKRVYVETDRASDFVRSTSTATQLIAAASGVQRVRVADDRVLVDDAPPTRVRSDISRRYREGFAQNRCGYITVTNCQLTGRLTDWLAGRAPPLPPPAAAATRGARSQSNASERWRANRISGADDNIWQMSDINRRWQQRRWLRPQDY